MGCALVGKRGVCTTCWTWTGCGQAWEKKRAACLPAWGAVLSFWVETAAFTVETADKYAWTPPHGPAINSSVTSVFITQTEIDTPGSDSSWTPLAKEPSIFQTFFWKSWEDFCLSI